MLKIHKQALAKQDLIDIWLYSYKTWGEAQADRYFDALEEGLSLIVDNPDIGFPCDYIRKGYRQYHIQRHIVFYTLTATTVTIVRVLHDSMDFKSNL